MSTRRTADREGSTRSGVPGGSERTVAPHITRRLKHGVPTVRVSQSLPTLPYPSPRQLSAARSWRHPSAPRDFRRAHGVICARDKDNFRRKYLSEVGNYCDCSLVPVGHCFVLFSPIFVDFISLFPSFSFNMSPSLLLSDLFLSSFPPLLLLDIFLRVYNKSRSSPPPHCSHPSSYRLPSFHQTPSLFSWLLFDSCGWVCLLLPTEFNSDFLYEHG